MTRLLPLLPSPRLGCCGCDWVLEREWNDASERVLAVVGPVLAFAVGKRGMVEVVALRQPCPNGEEGFCGFVAPLNAARASRSATGPTSGNRLVWQLKK